MIKKTILIPLLLAILSIGQAQDFLSLNVSNGLSNNQVNCIYKDNKGFMWFGTMSGLNRFDGSSCRVFRHYPADSFSISDDFISKIFPAPDNHLYIKTRNGDVVYNPQKEQFIKAAAWLGNYGLPANGITAVRAHNGSYWFAYDSGQLYRMDEQKHLLPLQVHHPANLSIADLAITNDNYLLVLSYNGDLEKINISNNTLVYRKNIVPLTADKRPLSLSVFADADNDYWIYMPGNDFGVMYMDSKNNTTKYFNSRNGALNNDIVNSVVQDDKGRIWIGTDHGGITILDKESFTSHFLVNREDDGKSIAENAVYSLYKDNLGIIWCGTYKKGISYYGENMRKFRQYSHQYNDPHSLEYNDLNCFAEDKKGNVWIGTNGGGLVYFDRQTGQFKQWKHSADPASISTDVILSMLVDDDNSLWIGYYFGGMDHFVNGKAIHYQPNPANPNSLAGKTVWKIYRDSQHNFWVGTLGNGLDRFDPEKGTFYHSNVNMPNSVHSNFISAMTEDPAGNLWIGTAYGIDMLDRSKGVFIHYLRETHGLSNDNVSTVHSDRFGNIWAGSRDGLSVFDPIEQRFRNFRMEDGLPDNNIISILEDKAGHLWVSTSNGLCKITVRREAGNRVTGISSRNFNSKDGLQGDAFNVNAALQLKSGELIFGGSDGFNLFDPAAIRQTREEPPLVFTSLQLFNRTIGVNEKLHNHVILNAALPETKEIVLRYNENDFSLDFAALDYINTDKNKYNYIYKLEGFNREWQTADSRSKRITYTNINPGNYVLHLKALNDDGSNNWKGISLRIIIQPPIWATSWAYIVYALLLAAMLFFLRRWVLQRAHRRFALAQERKEAQQLHELDMLKIKLFTNLSHEFRTPVSLILAPLDEVIRHEKDHAFKHKLYLIRRNARRLLNLVNQLMDFRRMEMQELKLDPTSGDIIGFIREVVYSFTDLAERKQMDFSFQTNTEALYTTFDHDKMERILFNLLSNAFKFTPANGSVRVYAEVEQGAGNHAVLQLRVQDTGIGIPGERQEKVFEQFFQSDVPGGFVSQGSGIGLAITREFVKLFHGTIHVDSEVNKGAVFTLRIPLEVSEPVENAVTPQPLYATESTPPEPEPITAMHEESRNGKATVLLVEDNDDFRFYLKENMKEYYYVIEAQDGMMGWQKALSSHPDLIVSDINMPLMDGISLCAKIKGDSRTRRIPVILLTAMAAEEQQLRGLEHGAADYLVKPFNFEIMLSRVRKVLASRPVQPMVIVSQHPEANNTLSADEKFMQKTLEIVEKNLSNPNFSVEELSRELCMNRVSVYRRIFGITGQPPIEFIRGVRLQRAAQLLTRSEMNITEVAYEVGFNNPKYFTKYFKMTYKMLPSVYAAANRK
ncbi:two-component regulator propeller domain-containing protein [Chitinophaga sp. Hz27]|uniref:hybrid sensor histidine kinase/response regulator transcription factor n=1 Tax=Chitinophaga sp. Hz27 TaxID=3347169 RepID=UPI0035D7DE5C